MSEDIHVVYLRPAETGADLSELSCRVDTVLSPAELTALLRNEDPTVVVFEYALPGRETGLDVLSRIRRTNPDLPLVLCTADLDGEVASAATRLGVTEYVPHQNDAEIGLCERLRPYIDTDRQEIVPDDLQVRADDQLRTAVHNIVENAVEHNDNQTPRVHITAMTPDGDPDAVEIRVADNGPGIPENERTVIAGDQSITQLNHASGLGLWLVRWIVDSYGGDISFEDSWDDGTVVSLSIDRAQTAT